mgnify:CR=1 FL=1
MLQTRPKSDYNYSYINDKEYNKKKNNDYNKLPKSGVVIFVLTVILIGTILVSYICQFVQITHLSYELNSLENRLDEIKEKNYLLNIKLAREKSMANIEKIARNDLDMIEPDKVEIMVLKNKEQIDTLPEKEEGKVFFVKVFNDFMTKIGTVKAEELD